MSSVLTIDGQAVELDDSRTTLQRLTLSVDQPDCLEFGQAGVSLPFAWHCGQAVTLTLDGTLRFKGEIESVHTGNLGDGTIAVGYRALGLKWAAGSIPVTNPQDGTGTCRFNLPSTDPDFIQQLSGMSVGAVLKYLFDGHATALATCGVTGYRQTDLDPLTIVPPTSTGVLIQGSSFIDQCEYFIQNWYAQYVLFIPADGVIRIVDSTAFTPATYTLDVDPITVDELSRDSSQCYTRVVIRGYADVEPAYLSLQDGTLKEHFTTADKLSWSWASFISPGGAISDGTIVSVTSTAITVQSADPTQTWPVNYWNSIEAVVQLVNPAVAGIAFTESRQITACTALSAGGTSVLTLDQPLVNSGYSVYHVWGQPPAVSDTWRLYDIVPTWVAQHLVKQSPHSVPWRPTDQEVVQTNFPAAVICYSANGQKPYTEFPATFELLPATGQIRFSEPTVRTFGTLSKLVKGGSYVDGIPDDIKVLAFYSRGTLQAVCPADVYGVPQYAGTGYTEDGIERTLYRDYPQWMWGADATSYQQLACQVLKTVQNTVVSGTLTYFGKLSSALTLGTAVNLARAGGATGFESVAAAARTVTLEYPQAGPTPWITRLAFSSVRRPFSGDALYAHPMFAGGQAFGGAIDMTREGLAQGLAQGLGWMGGQAGAETASRLFGDDEDVRKKLGLQEHHEPERRESAEPAGEGMFGGFGEGMEDESPSRRKPRRKRPTLRPARTRAAENSAGFVGPPAPIAGPPRALSPQGRRRTLAQRDHHEIKGRYDEGESKGGPAEVAGPPRPAEWSTSPAGPPRSLSLEGQREARARRDHHEIKSRHDDDETSNA